MTRGKCQKMTRGNAIKSWGPPSPAGALLVVRKVEQVDKQLLAFHAHKASGMPTTVGGRIFAKMVGRNNDERLVGTNRAFALEGGENAKLINGLKR